MLVATKEGLVVVLALADITGATASAGGLTATGDLGKIVHGELNRLRRGSPWRIAVGRAHLGGIARSYEEAREGLAMGEPHESGPADRGDARRPDVSGPRT